MLVEYVAEQAHYFMQDTGELHPFAVVLDNDGKVRQLTITWDNAGPEVGSLELSDALEAVIMIHLQADSIIGGIVCRDVFYKPPGKTEKVDAVEMALLVGNEKEYYCQSYIKAGNSFVFDEIVKR